MCHIITELLKKIEKQITHIFDNTNELKEKQIKDESHLLELSRAVDFITKTFDTYEQERKEREEIINNFTENVSRLAQKVDDLSEGVEKQTNIHDATACHCMEFLKRNKKMLTRKYLHLAINDRDIDRTHRIGNL